LTQPNLFAALPFRGALVALAALGASVTPACSSKVDVAGQGGGQPGSTSGVGVTTTSGVGGMTTSGVGVTTTSGMGVTTTSGMGVTTTGTTTSGSGGAPPGPCAPTPACTTVPSSCIALVDNAGQTTFGLRMNQITITTPPALSTGIVASTFGSAALPDLPACNLPGQGTLDWLLQFDTVNGTLTTGGAKPVADETQGYCFDNDMIPQGMQTFSLQPVVLSAPIQGGTFNATQGLDLVVPIFLDQAATMVVLLPLRQVRLFMGTLSADENCIGSYNAAALDPANGCLPDMSTPAFLNGASLDGFITLTDADSVVVTALEETLCVILSGNANLYGDGESPIEHCAKDANGKIVLHGDWCSATNAAATATCYDAFQLAGTFAAGAVKINTACP
jgi:hypothetical protein